HFEVGRDAVDLLHAAFEVLQVVQHHAVPQAAFLQIADQVGVHHGELAAEVRFDVQVLVRGLDALRHAGDVGDGGRRCDGHHVGVAHAFLLHALTQAVPVQRGAGVDLQVVTTTFLGQ